MSRGLLSLGLTLLLFGSASAADPAALTLAATTTTRDSGLLKHLLPRFEEKTGIEVRVVAVGTGRALELGRRGDVDVLLVHDRESEDRFVAAGHASLRKDVMFNEFVLLGPEDDPAGTKTSRDLRGAFRQIAERRAGFLSRGDDSGTHKAEMRVWAAAGVAVDPRQSWYRQTGNGMGATLNTASQLDHYLLCDLGTWLSFANRGRLNILRQGDPLLHNPYGVLMVSPMRHPHVREAEARSFVDWLTSAEGQNAIGTFRLAGRRAFFPWAWKTRPELLPSSEGNESG